MRALRCIRYAVIGIVWLCGPAVAQTTSDYDFTQNYSYKTIPLGYGGAYRAIADSTPAILLNPAGMTQRKGSVSISGDYVHSGFTSSNVLSVAAIDFKATESIALGFSYDRDVFTVADEVTVNQFTLAAAVPFGSMISFGGSVKGFISKVDSTFVNGPDGADIDLGMLVRPIPMVSLALTAHNLIQGSSLEEFPLQLAFGGALLLDPHIRIAVDMVRDFQTPAQKKFNAYFGTEFRAAEGMYLRGGFGLDRVRNNNFYSIGAAIKGPKIGLNFTFAQRLNPTDETYGANVEMYF